MSGRQKCTHLWQLQKQLPACAAAPGRQWLLLLLPLLQLLQSSTQKQQLL